VCPTRGPMCLISLEVTVCCVESSYVTRCLASWDVMLASVGRTSDAKERLIRSGGELVHQRGYSAVSVSDACSEAGVQKGSFYHFFESKVDFVASVIDEYSSRTATAFVDLASGDAPPLDRLQAYLDGACRFHAQLQVTYGKVLGCPIGNLAIEMNTLEAELQAKVENDPSVLDNVPQAVFKMIGATA